MNGYITYTATRSLISGRTAGDTVTLSLSSTLKGLNRRPKVRKNVKTSIGGKAFIAFERLWDEWKLTTIPLVNDDTGADLFREFLDSCVDQQFLFAPGSEYDSAASPTTEHNAILLNAGGGEKRVRIGPSVDRFTFTFTIQQVT